MSIQKGHKAAVLTIIKYLFSLALILAGFYLHSYKKYLVIQFLELAVIFALSNLIVKNHRLIGRIINTVLLLVLNAQILVLIFGSTYTSRVMLTNLFNIEDLAGKAGTYGLSAAVMIVITLLPISYLELGRINSYAVLSAALAGELAVTMVVGNAYSPFFAVYTLAEQQMEYNALLKQIEAEGDVTEEFVKWSVFDSRQKDEALGEQPNIIVIFTEGLSQHIIDDERNIMPNVRQYQQNGLSFKNYYNHTFATFRGLQGQLYSGYQLRDTDTNNLVSLQSMLSGQGYTTAFLNPEPSHREFSAFLASFGFDNIVGSSTEKYSGSGNSMTDKEAYEQLFETAEELSKQDEPFLLAAYTFGTYASFDSQDEVFGDGSVAELNKFWNCDVQFGAFMEKFEQSDFAENTLIVFTADHATYVDLYYKEAFPDYDRDNLCLDEVPLFFYYKGIQSETVNANGKNSLNLTPTILDYIDVTDSNYFLGYSLFYGKRPVTNFDTIYYDAGSMISSENDSIRELSEAEMDILRPELKKYFAAAKQGKLIG